MKENDQQKATTGQLPANAAVDLLQIGVEELVGATDRPAVARICDGHAARPRPSVLGDAYDAPEDHWAAGRPPVPPVEVFAYSDVDVRSDFMPYLDGIAITSDRVYPSYVASYYENPRLLEQFAFPTVAVERQITESAFCLTHFNMMTYGHFLLEVLPKLLLAARLRTRGVDAKVAFPATVKRGIAEALLEVVGPEALVLYQPRREGLRLSRALLPSLMTSPKYDLHDLFVEEIRSLTARITAAPATLPIPGPRIFISRLRMVTPSFRKLDNEAELFAVAAAYGFQLVHPQEFAWRDQVRMFAGATHVIGEYTSALHNTLFSPCHAKVISLGYLAENDVQSAIAASVGHKLGYLMPRSGALINFKPGWNEVQHFTIESADLRRCLDQVM